MSRRERPREDRYERGRSRSPHRERRRDSRERDRREYRESHRDRSRERYRSRERESRRYSRERPKSSRDSRRESKDRRGREYSRERDRHSRHSSRERKEYHSSLEPTRKERRESHARSPDRERYERENPERYERYEREISERSDRYERERSERPSERSEKDRNDKYERDVRPEVSDSRSQRHETPKEEIEKDQAEINMEATVKAAMKAAQEMEAIIQKRRERMEKWREQRKAQEVREQELEVKKWSLDNDEEEDENDGFNPEEVIKAAKAIQEASVKEVDDDLVFKKPKKRGLLFGKSAKEVGKKGIEFGLKKVENPKPVIAATRIVLEDDSIEMPVRPKPHPTESAPLVEKVEEIQEEKEMTIDIDEDPLDAFMAGVQVEVDESLKEVEQIASMEQPVGEAEVVKILNEESEDEEEEKPFVPTYDPEINQEDIMAAAAARVAQQRKDILTVDHSKIEYEPFRKDFYVEPSELSGLTKGELKQRRKDWDGIQVRGYGCPKPVERWSQLGLPPGIHEIIKKVLKYDIPTPIQAQAIPAIMSGRDVIGIARTGSGKTLAFVLPLLRHVKAQRPVAAYEGPIALIMTPTRELAIQIHKDCRPFLKALSLRAVCCYGGSPIKDNIAEVKRGAEVYICTPGRMIDLLCANNGKVTNLKRVTYLVLDESDRMFDMGFEPQVMKIVDSIRPDRQTVLFSATFPRFMEALARRVLTKPLEIIVGGRSIVPKDVTQIVQVHQTEESKYLRLLAILGKAANDDPNGKILIFVDRQEAADSMLDYLFKHGYAALSLHGGKDQADRDSVIQDFKNSTVNILVATSVAARGLDVKDLKIVINYECPNHLEDYVHRCGRTGRAGNKGTAYTFIMPSQAQYAYDIVKALKSSKAPIPNELQLLSDRYMDRVRLGAARLTGSGFGGRGLDRLITDRETTKKIQMKIHGGELNEAEDDKSNDVGIDKLGLAVPNSSEGRTIVREEAKEVDQSAEQKVIQAAKERAARLNNLTPADRARQILIDIAKSRPMQGRVATDAACWAEIEINDYPYKARMKVGSKEQIDRISHISGAAITTRGVYVPPGKQAPPGERKLYLFIEADQQYKIDRAKIEMKELLTEATVDSMEGSSSKGRYKVL